MAETTKAGCDRYAKWHWYHVHNDLVQQGGLDEKDILIDPLTVEQHGCGGKFKGRAFFITWVKDAFLLLSMVEHSQELVNAFAAVVGYAPFATYARDGYTTVEWDKLDPEQRWDALQGENGLTRLAT